MTPRGGRMIGTRTPFTPARTLLQKLSCNPVQVGDGRTRLPLKLPSKTGRWVWFLVIGLIGMGVVCLPVALGTAAVTASSAVVVFDGEEGPVPEEPWPTERTGEPELEHDDITIQIAIDADGTATWTVEYLIRLDDEVAEIAFEGIQTDVEENEAAFLAPYANHVNETVDAAADITGRSMDAHSFAVSTDVQPIPQSVGILRYEYVWENFAHVDGDDVEVGDAIAGFYLGEETSLLIEWKPTLTLQNVVPAPDDTREHGVIWNGQESAFIGEEPEVSLTTAQPPDDMDEDHADETDETDETTATDDPDEPADGADLEDESTLLAPITILGIAGVVVLIGGLAGALVWRRRTDAGILGLLTGARRSKGEQSHSGGKADAPGDDRDSSTADEELLSNEERVMQLLDRHDGRIKQKEIAEELDWTSAKTSRVVNSLQEMEKVEVYRLGRENVVTFPDEFDI